jgi:ketosteroid isomerase-like protein
MLIDMLADPKFALSFAPDKVVVAASGDLAYTSGTYSQTATDPKTHAVAHETGTYVTVYHKASEGSWKAVADINTPGPASP